MAVSDAENMLIVEYSNGLEYQHATMITLTRNKENGIVDFSFEGHRYVSHRPVEKKVFNLWKQECTFYAKEIRISKIPLNENYDPQTVYFKKAFDSIKRRYLSFIVVLDKKSENVYVHNLYEHDMKFDATKICNNRLLINWKMYDLPITSTITIESPYIEENVVNTHVQLLTTNDGPLEKMHLGKYSKNGDSFDIYDVHPSGSVIIPLNKKGTTLIGIFEEHEKCNFWIRYPCDV